MKIANQKDFWAGIMFLFFGVFFAGVGTQYKFGEAARMGPGYFPTSLGVILMMIGVVLALRSLAGIWVLGRAKDAAAGKAHKDDAVDKASRLEPFSFGAVAHVIGGVVLFGVLLAHAGLYVSILVLVLTTAHGSHEFRWRAAVLNALGLLLACSLIFVWGLELQFPLWPAFAGR